MKKLMWIGCFLLTLAVWARGYVPIFDGASVKLLLTVVDDYGNPVDHAEMDVVFQVSDERTQVEKGFTDNEGNLRVAGLTIRNVNVWVKKAGFYESHVTINARKCSYEEAVRSRMWAKDELHETITLRRQYAPIRLTAHSLLYKEYPAVNEVLKLDLETLAWCPPYGNGRHDDVHMVFDGWHNPDDPLNFYEHLTLTFPHCADGFYRRTIDATSAFPYDYVAQTNQAFEKTLALRFARERMGITNRVELAADEYLIYRVRTQTNEQGVVTSAHYGRIGEKMSHLLRLTMRSWFNPTENDPNLEDCNLSCQ